MKQKIKEYLKKVYVFRHLPSVLWGYYSDCSRWLKYSLSFNNKKENLKAHLLLAIHGLEKGLSFDPVKKGFGRANAENLLRQTELYISNYGTDEVCFLALGVLDSFIKNPESGKSDFLEKQVMEILNRYPDKKENLAGGIKSIDKVYVNFQSTFDELYQIASMRHSVRSFSQEDITEQQIKKAVKYAQTAPSVCNRQACKVHIFEGDTADLILQNQLGNQGWAHKANKLFIVTANLHFFGSSYERNQSFIDGGMFSMQFVMGLHAQKIASCCKMYIRTPALDKKLYDVTAIPKNEVPIMLILAGNYKEGITNVPYSLRLNQID